MKMSRKDFLRVAAGIVVTAGAGMAAQALGSRETAPAKSVHGKKRWGMVIDLQKCREEKGCDKCIFACHITHNVPNVPVKAQEVKWIWSEKFEKVFPFRQSEFAGQRGDLDLPVLCNHCTDPGCVRVCPTRATWKREDGIVMMDYHRCIGCRYCMAGCPYGSRSFNFIDPKPHIAKLNPDFPTRSAGVVEKCNFCEERLTEGRLPACVEACPKKALTFGDLNDSNSSVRILLRERFSIQRLPETGAGPSTFYLV